MPNTFQQRVTFTGHTPEELYDIYLDSERHAAAVGAEAWIEPKVGGRFEIFGKGAVHGRNLLLDPGRMIVQAWRGAVWAKDDPDSIVVLTFAPTDRGARIDLLHANVPEAARGSVNPEAWNRMYWHAWKAHLPSDKRTK
jgi:activator of HSP90 ATPase